MLPASLKVSERFNSNMSTQICSQTTSSTLLTAGIESSYIVLSVINGLCSFVTVVGNVLLIWAILQSSSLRHNPSFVLLCNLAVSDLGVGLISQPLFIAFGVVELEGDAELSCKINIAVRSTTGHLGVLSFLTLTAISFDRFLAVHLMLSYRRVVTVKRVTVVILLQWLIAISSGVTYVLDDSLFFFLIIIVICMCFFFTTFNYLAIAYKLNDHSAQLQAGDRDARGISQRKSFNISHYKKTLKSMLYVYGAFLMCYLPYLCFAIALKSIGHSSTVDVFYLITGTLVLANSAINPCLCYWRIKELQQAVQKLLGSRNVTVQEVTQARGPVSVL